MKEIRKLSPSKFIKGHIPWNTGTKGIKLANSGSFRKGQIPWNKGKKCPQTTGENHHNWKGGISETNRRKNGQKYKDWKRSVWKRDDYTCGKCGRRGGKLNAHHFKKWSKYPELRFELDNGITLCRQCHLGW